jgi:hypothetical protein
VAQIAKYVQFDEELRTYSCTSTFRSIPLGYTDFCLAWNNGTAVDDPRQFSTIFISDDPQDNGVVPSKYPVRLSEFFITPEQTSIVPINDQPLAVQAKINQEYTAIMAVKQRRQREFIEERRAKRPPHYPVYTPPPACRIITKIVVVVAPNLNSATITNTNSLTTKLLPLSCA